MVEMMGVNEILTTVFAFIGFFVSGVAIVLGILVLYHKIKGEL